MKDEDFTEDEGDFAEDADAVEDPDEEIDDDPDLDPDLEPDLDEDLVAELEEDLEPVITGDDDLTDDEEVAVEPEVEDDEAEDDEEEHDEALDELEAEELELLDDEVSESLLVDEVAELRAFRREELSLNVDAQVQRPDEFVCQSCFLVKRISQLANRRKMICHDCAG